MSYYNWFKHISVGKHQYQKERQSLCDFSIKTYADRIAASDVIRSLPAVNDAILSMGWAIKIHQVHEAFTAAQKIYLASKFDEGARTNIKHTPKKVAEDMRQLFVNKDDWLTPAQIRGWFSRYAKKRKKVGGLEGQTGVQAGATGQRGRGIGRGQTGGASTNTGGNGQVAEGAVEDVTIDQEDMDDLIASCATYIEASIQKVISDTMDTT